MLFIEKKLSIVNLCAYETIALIAPGVMISSTISSARSKENFIKNLLVTTQVSASYFVGCIARSEFSSLKNDNSTTLEDLEFTIGSSVTAGLVSYGTGYALNNNPSFSITRLAASVFSSTGYSLAFQHIPRPYLTPAIFAMEIGTGIIPEGFTTKALKDGTISGISFAIVDLLESTFNPQENTQPEESFEDDSAICPASNIFALDIPKVDMCEIDLTPAIFAMEIGTGIIPEGFTTKALKDGTISGISFAIVDLLESTFNPQENTQPEESFEDDSAICPASDIFALDIPKVDMCEIE